MNILFLSLLNYESVQERTLYTDLLREFVKNGHRVYAISPVERRQKQKTHMIKEKGARILRLKIGNTQKTNIIEKGISTVMIEPRFKWAIRKYFSNVRFDLVLYTTPPITLVSAISYVKKRDGAKAYLLLKDIFPQNAVDIGMMRKTGWKGILYRYFRKKEQRLYGISDHIGCMSPANVSYLLKHNPKVEPSKVDVCPNSFDVIDKSVNKETRDMIRMKYGIPLDKMVFVYGGNLGRPQDVPFIIKCLKRCEKNEKVFFLIVGDGTEAHYLKEYIDANAPRNVLVMDRLPKEDYDTMVGACDVGLIFLDHRFTIPNFPSRLLSYMQAKLPVLACTDSHTDLGRVVTEGGFGWWCKSDSVSGFCKLLKSIQITEEIREKGFEYLKTHYSSEISYNAIMNSIKCINKGV